MNQISPDSIDRPFAKPTPRRSLIRLTPLIDVVFILLVFFMLVSSFQSWRAIKLDAPANIAHNTFAKSMEGGMLIEIRPDGIRLSGQPVTLAGLSNKLAQRVSKNPELQVLVKPAPSIPLQDTIYVIDALEVAGVPNVSLIHDANR